MLMTSSCNNHQLHVHVSVWHEVVFEGEILTTGNCTYNQQIFHYNFFMFILDLT